jgi:hypothetical protein
MAREELTRLTGNGNGECNQNGCLNLYRTASGSIIVQGGVSAAFTPPQGEGLVEIPESVLREAIRALGGEIHVDQACKGVASPTRLDALR